MRDCLIIGGGVVGLSLAWDLARHGKRVHVVDQGQPGREASWAGAGIIPAALQRGDQHPRIVEFGDGPGRVAHRRAAIEQEGAAQVGVLVGLFQVKAVRPPEEPPVDVAEIIALRVGAVLGEFDGRALLRAPMQPGPESLDHRARQQIQILQRDPFGGIGKARHRSHAGSAGEARPLTSDRSAERARAP